MSSRIIVTGPPGSGKTTLLDSLRIAGHAVVDEPARRVIADYRNTTGEAIYATDPQLFLDKMLDLSLADFHGASGTTFFDRGLPDLVGYAGLFGLPDTRYWDAARGHRYAEKVFVLPSWPEVYTTDGDRRMTFEQAASFGARVQEVYEELGYVMVEVPKAPTPERASFVIKAIVGR